MWIVKIALSRPYTFIVLALLIQVWLAVSDDPAALVSGEYFYHMNRKHPLPAARDVSLQNRLLDFCSHVTGVELPA